MRICKKFILSFWIRRWPVFGCLHNASGPIFKPALVRVVYEFYSKKYSTNVSSIVHRFYTWLGYIDIFRAEHASHVRSPVRSKFIFGIITFLFFAEIFCTCHLQLLELLDDGDRPLNFKITNQPDLVFSQLAARLTLYGFSYSLFAVEKSSGW